ncbi:Uncharacterized protein PECH_002574 [Penicillium ucsense]|uniref:ABM domain-containing protein n=1 Tax=Penicillium ucsense TaxID=2839758 RepID=A0A8J8WH62_9EURO|nr:Uncharacterized protein PECM_002031 [Penicillium ucsense]KAF7730732.1 Uncharacterized protein PECH_002574 [Penicillium ucsense]
MAQMSTQFIFLDVKSEVEPENPASDLGEALLELFRATKSQSGHRSSAWGRSIEEPKNIVWVIDWTDARCSINPELLKPFLANEDQPLTAVYATLTPPISSTDTLTKNPVTELFFLPVSTVISEYESRQLHADLIKLRSVMVTRLPQAEGPVSWSMGQLGRPSTVRHEQSPSGRATVHLLIVGWESVETHSRARETKEFVDVFTPVSERLLPPIPELGMKHVRFQSI